MEEMDWVRPFPRSEATLDVEARSVSTHTTVHLILSHQRNKSYSESKSSDKANSIQKNQDPVCAWEHIYWDPQSSSSDEYAPSPRPGAGFEGVILTAELFSFPGPGSFSCLLPWPLEFVDGSPVSPSA